MNFRDLMSIAVENTSASASQKKIGFSTDLGGATKKDDKKNKGINSAAVRKFLERQELEAKKKELAARKAAMKQTEKSDSSTDRPDEAPEHVEELFKKSARVAHSASKTLTDEQKREMQEKMIRVARGLKGLPVDSPESTKPKESSSNQSAEKKKRKVGASEDVVTYQKEEEDKYNNHNRADKHDKYKDKHKDKHKDSEGHSDLRHKHKHKKHKHDKQEKVEKSLKQDRETHKEKEVQKIGKPKIKKRVNPAAPPPMNFNDILKLAETKQFEPVEIKPKEVKKEERPMTQEEKNRAEFRKTKEYKDWYKHGKKLPTAKPQLESRIKCDKAKMIRTEKDKSMTNMSGSSATDTQKVKNDISNHPRLKGEVNDKVRSKSDSVSQEKATGEKQIDKHKEKVKRNYPLNPYLDFGPHAQQLKKTGINARSHMDSKNSQGGKTKDPSRSYDMEKERVLVCGPSASRTADATSRDMSPAAEMSPWDRIYNKVHKVKDSYKDSGKQRIESDEDYDDDDDEYEDDFVVDDEEDIDGEYRGGDYSKAISEIFGYDKKKYRDMDDDVDDMEVGFAQQMAEEKRSAKLGKLEDLEDIKREEMHKKRKMMLKKQSMKKMRR